MTPYDFWNSQFNQTVLRNIQENNLRAAQFRVESELRMQRMHASMNYLHQLPCQGISMSNTGMLRTTYGPIEQNFVDYWSSYRGDGQPTRQEVFRSFFKQAVDMAAHANLIESFIGYMREHYVLEVFKRYDEGATMTDIRDWLNGQGIKNAKGQQMTYNSIDHILKNRRYRGEYKYRDIVVPDGIPAIIPQDLFDRVQEKLEKNRRAPARHKAEEDYLLTTKLYCGYCGAYPLEIRMAF